MTSSDVGNLYEYANYLGELNALYPFREGNGRTQRAFFSALAREAGYTRRWDLICPGTYHSSLVQSPACQTTTAHLG